MSRNNTVTYERGEAATDAHTSGVHDFPETLGAGEGVLLGESVRALQTIRYGSITLTVHDGRIVEIHKTERIRRI